MKKGTERFLRLCSGLGGALAILLVGSAALFSLGALLAENTWAAGSVSGTKEILSSALRSTGFTFLTALCAVVLAFPMAWSLSAAVVFLLRPTHLLHAARAISGFSAIPAVVFGFMGLNYIAPLTGWPWLGVTMTLVMMGLMDLTLSLIRVHVRQFPAVEAAAVLGANLSEALLGIVVPRAAREYLDLALRMLTRNMGEGVAILLVLSAYSGGSDTLVTALMKASGVTGESVDARLTLLLAGILLILVLLSNALITRCREGGRHGEKKTAK